MCARVMSLVTHHVVDDNKGHIGSFKLIPKEIKILSCCHATDAHVCSQNSNVTIFIVPNLFALSF
jgi:hypothetical protein